MDIMKAETLRSCFWNQFKVFFFFFFFLSVVFKKVVEKITLLLLDYILRGKMVVLLMWQCMWFLQERGNKILKVQRHEIKVSLFDFDFLFIQKFAGLFWKKWINFCSNIKLRWLNPPNFPPPPPAALMDKFLEVFHLNYVKILQFFFFFS